MDAYLTPERLLRIWEAGLPRRPLDRALIILWAAGVSGDLTDLPISERDRVLLQIRAATFGPDWELRATCSTCAEELEMTLHVPDLTKSLPVDGQVEVEGCDFAVRQLTSRDLAAASIARETEIADVLRTRLTLPADPPAILYPAIDAAIEAQVTENELSTTLKCTGCAAIWREVLDVADLLWTEIETAAIALLGEVAEIAAALGWAERDILALPVVRRQVYLSLARQS